MNAITPTETTEAFVPLALEKEDIAAYSSIATTLGCDLETCVEAFIFATPKARDTAVELWKAVVVLGAPSAPSAEERAEETLKGQQALDALRALLGLDPERMPHDMLAAAGLRYSL